MSDLKRRLADHNAANLRTPRNTRSPTSKRL